MEIEGLGIESGIVVARASGRRHAGLLIQGDSMLSLLQDLEEEAPSSCALRTVRGWVAAYEKTLRRLKLELPYPDHQGGDAG